VRILTPNEHTECHAPAAPGYSARDIYIAVFHLIVPYLFSGDRRNLARTYAGLRVLAISELLELSWS
jgi:hypothetical protein